MNTLQTTSITTLTTVQAPIAHVWNLHTSPAHIFNWMNLHNNYILTADEYSFFNEGDFNLNFAPSLPSNAIGFEYAGTLSNILLNETITYNFVGGFALNVTFNVLGENVEIIYDLNFGTIAPHNTIVNFFNNLLTNFNTYVSVNH